jgi:diguanylate cyclase (GGDEF)-like protein
MMPAEGINPVVPQSIDLGRIIEYRDSISGLTCLDFSVYDSRGSLLVPSMSEDPLLRIFLHSETAKKEHDTFIKRSIENSFFRKGASVIRGPLNQYHCFIPAQAGDICLVFAGNAFYLSRKDLEDLESKGSTYGLSPHELESWAKGVVLGELGEITEECEHVYRLFNLSMNDMHEATLNIERYRRARIIIDLLSEIKEDMDEYKIYNLLADAILFLFGGETVSLMIRSDDKFAPILTKGRLKEKVEGIMLRGHHPVIADAIQRNKPLVCTEAFQLLRSGYPADITSLHLFPMSQKDETFGLLGVFNSFFPNDDIDNISKLCSIIGFIVKTSRSKERYAKHISDISAIDFAAIGTPAFTNPDTLYESIVEISSRLMHTERASLMLPEEEQGELRIKTVKGIDKWVAGNIRVGIGEGIAGKVYKEGQPLVVTDMERTLATQKKPNYRTRSFVSLPLKIGDEAIGVLNLADRINGEVFSEEDMKFLQHFASCASLAIKGAHYCRKLEEMRTLSITDSLTGLFNRRYFDDRLFEELQRAIRYDSFFTLAISDIDDFKLFNDTEGHLEGDEVLKSIADISRESVRSIDIVARFGGEEFAIIMPQTEKDEALLVAERTRKNIKELMSRSWEKFPRKEITVSIGIATFPSDGKDAKTLIRNADKALYRAKVSGKDRTVTWDAASMTGKDPAA